MKVDQEFINNAIQFKADLDREHNKKYPMSEAVSLYLNKENTKSYQTDVH